MCVHQAIELMGKVGLGQGKRPLPLYTCKQCRLTVVLRDERVVEVDYREFQ